MNEWGGNYGALRKQPLLQASIAAWTTALGLHRAATEKQSVTFARVR